jgi:EAL domain-containing protein (putative c-di-GMP-specific phosphodiesterase class I)
MNKKIVKLAFIVPVFIGSLVLASVLAINAVRHVIIEDNEHLVHTVAQSILPALLANDTQQVEALMKTLESYPGIQSAELISAQGVSIASYSRYDQSVDSSAVSFELASVEADPNQLHVMAPITFDSLIVANLHIAINLWPMYLKIMTWLGVLLIVPSALYVFIKQSSVKLRFEVIERSGASGGGGDSFDVDQAVSTAMADADITLEFQPVKRMSDAGMFGMEVVVCWRHPSGQTLYVSPGEFVAFSQKNGVCLPFDDWLLATACKKAAAWQHLYGPLILTFDVCASQFKNPEFAQKVRAICEQTQYPHQLLEIEVHESVISSQPQVALACVQRFTAQGLSVTVDNFGLLNQSVNLFETLPISKVKLDRKVVKRLGVDEQITDLVQVIIANAVMHDVQVMAEGVESSTQRDLLQSMGCILGQGTYFQPPLSSADFESFLASRPFDASVHKGLKMGEKLHSTDSQGIYAA